MVSWQAFPFLPPSSRALRVSLAPKTPFPFPFKRLPRRLATTGFEPMASALALQCSTNWALRTHTLRAGQYFELGSERIVVNMFPFTSHVEKLERIFNSYRYRVKNMISIVSSIYIVSSACWWKQHASEKSSNFFRSQNAKDFISLSWRKIPRGKS